MRGNNGDRLELLLWNTNEYEHFYFLAFLRINVFLNLS